MVVETTKPNETASLESANNRETNTKAKDWEIWILLPARK